MASYLLRKETKTTEKLVDRSINNTYAMFNISFIITMPEKKMKKNPPLLVNQELLQHIYLYGWRLILLNAISCIHSTMIKHPT